MNGPWKIYFEEAGVPDTAVELIKRISRESSKSVWYRHPNGKRGKGPHYHGLVFDYAKSDDTCREWIKEALNIKGSQLGVSNKLPKEMGGAKMTEELTPRYVTYMSKGKFEPVYKNGYDDMEIAVLRNQWVDYDNANANDNASANANVMVCYVEKDNKNKITQYVLARMVHSRYLDEVGVDNVEVGKLVKITIKVLKENKKLAHKRMVANIVQDVLADVNFEEYSRQIISML